MARAYAEAQLALDFTARAPVVAARSRTRVLVDELRAALGDDVRVAISDGRSTLLQWTTTKDGARAVRVHQMFLDAPDDVRAALARWLHRGDKKAGAVVDAFADQREHLMTGAPRAWRDDAHVGAHHDLGSIYVEVNERYFAPPIVCAIGWGLAGHPQRKRGRVSITYGTWDDVARRVTIHPCLDQAHVPRLCIARVVHHELLHAKHPSTRGDGGRRVVHGPEFRREEARFLGAAEADAWFDRNLDALLRWRPA